MPIEILVVDDSERKINAIRKLAEGILAPDSFALDVVHTVHAAGQRLRSKNYDLLILDISVPMRDGEAPSPTGGVSLLNSLRIRTDLRRPTFIIGLTAYGELHEAHAESFRQDLWYLVRYDDKSTEWERSIGAVLVHILETKSESSRGEYDYDLAIITALHRIELESVLALPGGWRLHTAPEDATIYHVGEFNREGRRLRVVAAAATEMGMPAATALSMKLIQRFTPRYIAMTGIAAGVKGQFGDVLVADQSWDYGSGKSRHTTAEGSMFLPAPSSIPLDPSLKAKFSYFSMDRSVLRKIFSGWKETAVTSLPEVRIGPVASGSAVVESRPLIDEIISHNRKLIGIEMETYGVFMASKVCCEPRPSAMSVKSICDFGDERKNDDYQAYAAYTSAQYLYEFALDQLATQLTATP